MVASAPPVAGSSTLLVTPMTGVTKKKIMTISMTMVGSELRRSVEAKARTMKPLEAKRRSGTAVARPPEKQLRTFR